jgi:hypothetical protein
MKTKIALCVLALVLAACGNGPRETWYKDYSGNQIEVQSGTINSHVFTTASNQSRAWVGDYKGGEEQVPARKILFHEVAKEEAARICGGYERVLNMSETTYNMTDSSDASYGGGLLGLALNHAFSSYDNIPVAGQITYDCAGGNPYDAKDEAYEKAQEAANQ